MSEEDREELLHYFSIRIANTQSELKRTGYSCQVVKGHYGSVTAKKALTLYRCLCIGCAPEFEMRHLLKQRKKLL